MKTQRAQGEDWAARGIHGQDPRVAREFAKAARSRRRVRLLKIMLPVLAGLIVLGGIAVTVIARAIPDDLQVAGASIKDGRVVMDDPRMSGVDSNDRPFELVAKKAMQTIADGAIDLEGIDATVAISDDSNATIRAVAGHYEPEEQRLALSKGLTVTTDDGLNIAMRSAGIDLQAGTLDTDEPVQIRTADQEIRANAMTVSDNGKRIRFTNGVSLTLKPGSVDMTSREAGDDTRLADSAPTVSGD